MSKFNNLFSPETRYAKFMNVLAGVIWTGLLWMICSLPIVTMGTASAAAHDTMRRAVRKQGIPVTRTFFVSFKANFKVTLPFNIILTLVFALLFFDSVYLYGYGTEFSQMLSIIIYVFVAFFIVLAFYIFTLCSYFDETRFEITKLAFYIYFRHFHFSLLFFFMFLLGILAVYMMPWSVMLIPGFFWYAQVFFMQFIMKHYVEEDEEDEEEEPWHVKDEEEMSEEDEEEATKDKRRKRNKNAPVVTQTADLKEVAERLLLDSDPDRIIEK